MATVSCATGAGIEELKRTLFAVCPEQPPLPLPADDEGLADFLVYRPRPAARRGYRIYRTDRGFRVGGTPPADDELAEALRAAGAKPGDLVEVAGQELEYQ